ncbi:MAG: hypothetical protein WBM90_00315 [Acidimicrobiia bacterium]
MERRGVGRVVELRLDLHDDPLGLHDPTLVAGKVTLCQSSVGILEGSLGLGNQLVDRRVTTWWVYRSPISPRAITTLPVVCLQAKHQLESAVERL